MIGKLRQLLRDRQRLQKQVRELQGQAKTVDRQELLSQVESLIRNHYHDSRYYTKAEADAKASDNGKHSIDQPTTT